MQRTPPEVELGRNKMRMRINQVRPSFSAESTLPLTAELATVTREALEPLLVGLPAEWSYFDRVLVFLAPSVRSDVERFHDKGKRAMSDMFEEHQLEHLDQTLLASLYTALETHAPGLLAARSEK
jgi:hypothetical protein